MFVPLVNGNYREGSEESMPLIKILLAVGSGAILIVALYFW